MLTLLNPVNSKLLKVAETQFKAFFLVKIVFKLKTTVSHYSVTLFFGLSRRAVTDSAVPLRVHVSGYQRSRRSWAAAALSAVG